MNKSIGLVVVCLLGLTACNVEHYDDCDDDSFDFDDDYGDVGGKGPGTPGTPGKAGSDTGSGATGASAATGGTSSEGGSSSSAGTGSAGAPEVMEPLPTPCEVEHDCGPGFNCDLEAKVCVASDAETCPELVTEQECTDRPDCTPIYGGTNCSCGADCECKGGEPGCVCEEFGFVVCR